MKAKFTNKHRITYILSLFITLFLVSCGDSEENNNTTQIKMSLTSYANNGLSENFPEILSYKVEVLDAQGSSLESSKCTQRGEDLGFNLNDGVYTFKFSGYTDTSCAAAESWTGDSTLTIKKTMINYVKIPIAKVGEFTVSSIKMQSPGAFMSTIQVNDKVFLSGGVSYVDKNLKRLTNTPCNKGDSNCICISDRCSVIDEECEKQGMSKADCTRCLAVRADDINSFQESEMNCLIKSCPINAEGNGCNLKGRTSVQYLDVKNLHSDLESLETEYIRLSETRIFHKSYLLGSKVYFVGGAP